MNIDWAALAALVQQISKCVSKIETNKKSQSHVQTGCKVSELVCKLQAKGWYAACEFIDNILLGKLSVYCELRTRPERKLN